MNARGWFAQRPLGLRVVLVIVALVVAVNVAIFAAQAVSGGQPGGATASAHATAPDGYAGWADLLQRSDRRVVLLDHHLADARLAPGATVVVAQPQGMTDADARSLRSVLDSGGRIVLVGSSSAAILDSAGAASVGWTASTGGPAAVLAPAEEVTGVSDADTGIGSFTRPGPLLPVLGHDGQPVALVGGVGRGRVVAVASLEMFDNAHLASADNAVFALNVAGPPGSTVYFDEADHGYGPSSGFSALPSGWQWAAGGLVLACLVWLWVRGKRLGPAEERERALAPPRRLHVDALTAAIARSRDDAGTGARLWASVRAELAQATGIAVDDPRFPAAARDRAAAAGVPEHELAVLEVPPADPAALEALGSVAARLSRTRATTSPGGAP